MNYVDIILLEFAKNFLKGRLTAEVFAEAFVELWRIRRDNMPVEQTQQNEQTRKLGSCISSLFLSADSYDPDPIPSLKDAVLDEAGLRKEVSDLISEYLGYEYK